MTGRFGARRADWPSSRTITALRKSGRLDGFQFGDGARLRPRSPAETLSDVFVLHHRRKTPLFPPALAVGTGGGGGVWVVNASDKEGKTDEANARRVALLTAETFLSFHGLCTAARALASAFPIAPRRSPGALSDLGDWELKTSRS